MGKIKQIWKNLSLKKCLLLCMLVFVLLDLSLSCATCAFCNSLTRRIYDAYPPMGEKFYLTNESGERLGGDGAYISNMPLPLSAIDEKQIAFLNFLPVAAVPLYSVLCIIGTILLFYRSKLKIPLETLKNASEKIALNDLHFSLPRNGRDELGQLCCSFETMRATLAENFSEMWRQVEERRRLNAAFAHELRTPLTVLKGYSEMLLADNSHTTRKTAAAMTRHILRLERYADSMSRLHRLEDARPEAQLISLAPFLSSLAESASFVCRREGKSFLAETAVSRKTAYIDPEFVSQVSGNLISNAVRFARTAVTLTFGERNGCLALTVSDDGEGFDKDTLRQAVNPYFTREKSSAESSRNLTLSPEPDSSPNPELSPEPDSFRNPELSPEPDSSRNPADSQHFGLGLYICRLLCEHHGGFLQITSTQKGTSVTAFFQYSENKQV